MISVIGGDEEGQLLRDLFGAAGIETSPLLVSQDRITTQKTRVIARNQQMMRLDREVTSELSVEWQDRLFEGFCHYMEAQQPMLVIFEDYDKGVLAEPLIHKLVDVCRSKGILTAVDPKKRNFLSYRGVDIFKPNLKEVREGLGMQVLADHPASLDKAHAALAGRLGHRISLITLSEHGLYVAEGSQSHHIPSHARSISDVSGAGDTVISVAALAFAVTGNLMLAAEMANMAGGLVCEEVGTAAISPARLEEEFRNYYAKRTV